jgi:glycolate oxidase FAD binding subunit
MSAPESLSIDGVGPMSVVRPASAAEVGDVVRRAAAEGQALFPLGGRTQLDLGLPPARPGIGVDLRSLDQVIDYPARDMTITVQAGITLKRLQGLLAAENQRLPVDVPRAAQATLGGALATSTSGPRRHSCGTLRDYVIGITTINDEGHETKAGGRVVKNVAGYDLCKLHIGALGTLGIITQVTLKLRPVPESKHLFTMGCEPAQLAGLLDLLHSSRTRPACMDVLNAPAALAVSRAAQVVLPTAPWVIVLGFEDTAETGRWQFQQLLTEVAPAGVRGIEARAESASETLWNALVEQTAPAEARLGIKVNLLSSAVAGLCLHLGQKTPAVQVQAHAGAGIVRVQAGEDLTLESAEAMVKELCDLAQAAKGNLVLPRCPTEWKGRLPVWGLPRGDAVVMRQVKEKLDPRRLFNPGRFVEGT